MSSTDPRPVRRPASRGLRRAGLAAAVVLVAIVAVGLAQRARSNARVRDWTARNALPVVTVVQPQPIGAATELQLPGRLEPYAQAPIYARANGYVKSWKVDIGAHVKAGQLLAEIEAPDVDQQLAQARADLAKAQADAALAKTTAERWQGMLGSDAVSRQEVDEKTGDYAAKRAAENAARANVELLEAMQGFQRIVAPFDGTVISRSTDVGALVNAGAGSPLFTIADTRRLRVYVQVPQTFMPSISVGQSARLSVPEYPGRSFEAKVESTASAVDASSGATLVQMVVDNRDGALLGGSYADVSIELPGGAQGSSIPASSLLFDGSGTHVALLGADGKVQMKPVEITRDLGRTLEVSGLAADARVIDSPSDALRDGDAVRIAEKPAADEKHDAQKKG